MTLDLTQFRQPDTLVSRRFEPAAFEGRSSLYTVVAPVDLRFTVHKDQDRYRLVGRVVTRLEQPCSRCLEGYQQAINTSFDIRYLPQSDDTPGDERQAEDDDFSEAFYQDEQIDLLQLMEEQFYLALPMKPLCRDDCKGLCANCGSNLNETACSCQVRWEDPRLAGLKAFVSPDLNDA